MNEAATCRSSHRRRRCGAARAFAVEKRFADDVTVDHDGVAEGIARQDTGWTYILIRHLDNTAACFIGDLATFTVRRGNGRTASQRHAQGFSQGIGNFLSEFVFDTTRAGLNLLFNDCLDRYPYIPEKRMFGGLGFFHQGNMLAFDDDGGGR